MQCGLQLCLHSCCLAGSPIQRGELLGVFTLQRRKVFLTEGESLPLLNSSPQPLAGPELCMYSTPAGIDTYSCLSPAHQGKTEVEKARLMESCHKWPRFCLSSSFMSAQGEQVLADISSRPSNCSCLYRKCHSCLWKKPVGVEDMQGLLRTHFSKLTQSCSPPLGFCCWSLRRGLGREERGRKVLIAGL